MLDGCARKLFFAGESNQVGGRVKSSVEVMFRFAQKVTFGSLMCSRAEIKDFVSIFIVLSFIEFVLCDVKFCAL
jgi:hypothetical protein